MARPTPPADPRRAAWRVLEAVEAGAFADAALGTALRTEALAPRDRGLATQLVYGTLAWQGQLDHILAGLGRPAARLDPPVRTLLRLALFQLVRLDRVPAFAAVDTAVELAKSIKSGNLSGLVNALLRRFLREGRPLFLPPPEAPDYLALAHSHPAWLVERWRRELGEAETAALLAADNTAAPTVLRVNPTRSTRERMLAALQEVGVAAHPTTWAADGVVLDDPADPAALPGHAQGWFAPQGEASQLVAALLGDVAGAHVLDACAAPGGKTLAAAARGARVLALDAQRAGLLRLRAEATRLGARLAVVQASAAAPPLPAAARFDAVLVDAPCSGLGTLRQHPEIRWRRQPRDLVALAALQRRILAGVAVHVAPGGALVYATCTLARVENDDVVAAFLAAHPAFRVDDPRPFLPPPAHALVDAGGALRTYPHRHGLDGFYAVRLARR